MKAPLVTVIVPCFEDGATLPMALASLGAQSWEEWECVVVDDGSREGVGPVVEAFGDRRMRVVTLSENRGRSAARQVALEEAKGEYVAMLDADDWYYPGKLGRQVEILEARRELSALSMGMAVVDRQEGLAGVRAFAVEELEVFEGQRGEPPKMAFGAVMMRGEVAKRERFDVGLERSEDWDYLMRALDGRLYGVLGEVGYVYREEYSARRMEEARVGFRCQRKIFRDRIWAAPGAAGREYLKSVVKSGIYGVAQRVGGGEWLFGRRNREATDRERAAFEEAREVVWEKLREAGFEPTG